jgi:hypothetical protein
MIHVAPKLVLNRRRDAVHLAIAGATLFLLVACKGSNVGAATAGAWPPPSLGRPFAPTDGAACWTENADTVDPLVSELQAALDDSGDLSGPAIATGRKANATAISTFLGHWGRLRLKYHDRSQMQSVLDGLTALKARFAKPMSEEEFRSAWSEAFRAGDQVSAWADSICYSIEELGGTPPPPRY